MTSDASACTPSSTTHSQHFGSYSLSFPIHVRVIVDTLIIIIHIVSLRLVRVVLRDGIARLFCRLLFQSRRCFLRSATRWYDLLEEGRRRFVCSLHWRVAMTVSSSYSSRFGETRIDEYLVRDTCSYKSYVTALYWKDAVIVGSRDTEPKELLVGATGRVQRPVIDRNHYLTNPLHFILSLLVILIRLFRSVLSAIPGCSQRAAVLIYHASFHYEYAQTSICPSCTGAHVEV